MTNSPKRGSRLSQLLGLSRQPNETHPEANSSSQPATTPSDMIVLEDRVMYSAVPLIDPADVVDAPSQHVNEDLGELFADVFQTLETTDALVEAVNGLDHWSESTEGLDSEPLQQLVVVDESVEDLDKLLSGLNGDPESIKVITVAKDQNGFDLISQSLDDGRVYSSIHIFSHGSSGSFQLGQHTVNNQSVDGFADQMSGWRESLSEDADILIYGCDLAESESGQQLVERVAQWTGADVAASQDITGHESQGGDWHLEYAFGQIESTMIISEVVQAEWNHTLAVDALPVAVDSSDSITQDMHGLNRGSVHSVASDANGNFVVVWSEFQTDGDGWGVFAQKYNYLGQAQGAAFQVNETTSDHQHHASVGMDANGNFVVTWTSHGQDSSSYDVYFRKYSAEGTVGSETLVNDTTGNFRGRNPSISMNENGEFAIAWEGRGSGDNRGIYAKAYDSDGVAKFTDVRANSTTSGKQENADVSIDANGNFAVSWNDDDGVYFQRFDDSGNKIGSEFQARSNFWFLFTPYDHYEASIDLSDDGQLAIAYTISGGGNEGVDGRIYDAGNSLVGTMSGNQSTTGSQTDVSIARGNDGNYVMTWSGQGTQSGQIDNDSGVFVRTFDSDGDAISSETRINAHTAGIQEFSSVAVFDANHYVVAWSGEGSGDSEGIYYSVVDDGTPINQTPITSDGVIFATENNTYTFVLTDFNYSDTESDPLDHILVEQIPAKGELRLLPGNTLVNNGDVINAADITSGNLVFIPEDDSYTEKYAAIQFKAHDGNRYALQSSMLTIDLHPENVIFVSTRERVDSGGSSTLDSWEDSDLIQIGGTNLQLGENTDSTLSVPFSLEKFIPGAQVDALHIVQSNLTLGDGVSFDLRRGDILFSTHSAIDIGLTDDLATADIAVFRPTSSDYSTGTFHVLFDASASKLAGAADMDNIVGLSLVERTTKIGDTIVEAGTLLIAEDASGIAKNIQLLKLSDTGEGTSVAAKSTLVDGNQITNLPRIDGLELVERTTTVGGVKVEGGSILISIDSDNRNIGDGVSVNVHDEDIVALRFESTTLGSGDTVAYATKVFDGSDVGLNHGNREDLDAIAMLGDPDTKNAAPVVNDQLFDVQENSANGTRVGQVAASDSDSGDSLTYSIVGGTGASAFTVDKTTGEIFVADHYQLDREYTPSFTLVVQVEDLDGLVDTANITIDLNHDPNERWIQGRILEDTDGDGSLLNDGGRLSNVDVRLYRDINGDGLLDAGDQLVRTTTTDANGSYVFSGLDQDDYFVVVNSKSITSTLNGGYTSQDLWAQQTYGVAGSVFNNGSGDQVTSSDGFLFGGRQAGVSDDWDDLSQAQHINRVTLGTNNVSEIDFGFSFNVVTNTLGGDNQDDDGDGSNHRTVQGSLRQFIANANAISGDNDMRFVPVVEQNVSIGGNRWWRIEVTQDLGDLVDAGTTIDGTAYDKLNPNRVIDSNAGFIGSGGVVGTTDQFLVHTAKSELELLNVRGAGDATAVDVGLDVQASRTTIEYLSVHGFGDGSNSLSGNIMVGSVGNENLTGITIRHNVIGSFAHQMTNNVFALPITDGVSAQPNASSNIVIYGADNGLIHNNMIGYADEYGIGMTSNANSWTIQNNEIRANGLSGNAFDGILLLDGSSQHVIQKNLIVGNYAYGIDAVGSNGNNVIVDNTISDNGVANHQTAGIRLAGDHNVVGRNEFTGNTGAGVLVVSDFGSFDASQFNTISQNNYDNNGGLSIDLVGEGGSNADNRVGDGRTLNDGGTHVDSANLDIDYPLIQAANFNGANTTISGTAIPDSTVEVYLAGGDGIGLTYLGSAIADAATGEYSTTLTGLNAGDSLVTIAIDDNGNTSEFSDAVDVNVLPTVSGTNTYNINDKQSARVFGAVTIADPDGNVSITIQLTNGDQNGLFTAGSLVDSGFAKTGLGTYELTNVTSAQATTAIRKLVFQPTENQVAPGSNVVTSFQIDVEDRTGTHSDSSTVATVTSVNDAPQVNGPANVHVDENVNGPIFSVSSSDVDGGAITYSLSGPDAHLFTVHPSTGVVSLVNPMDHEAPLDADSNNVYRITVNANDAHGASSPHDVRVVVDPVNDNAPVFQTGPTINGTENQAFVANVQATDADRPGDTLTYSLTGNGDDHGLFSIHPNTGALHFVTPPDFDAPADLDGNNVYEVEVAVSDGQGLQTFRMLQVQVQPVVETPVAFNDAFTLKEGHGITVAQSVLVNDLETDFGATTANVVSGPSHGTLNWNSNGTFVYVHNGSETVHDSFVYQVSNSAGTSRATVNLTIQPVNDKPIAGADDMVVGNDSENIFFSDAFLLSNDFDAEGSSLSVVQIIDPSTGTVVDKGGGNYELMPNEDFVGIHEIHYVVSDGDAQSVGTLRIIQAAPLQSSSVDTSDPEPTNPDDPPAEEPVDTIDSSVETADPENGVEPEQAGNRSVSSGFEGTEDQTDSNEENGVAFTLDSNQSQDENQPASYSFKSIEGNYQATSDLARSASEVFDVFGANTQDIFAEWSGELTEGLNLIRHEYTQLEVNPQTVVTFAAGAGVLTVGYVFWMVRGGLLVASFVSSVPMWQSFDPLPILQYSDGESGDGESLESLVDNSDFN